MKNSSLIYATVQNDGQRSSGARHFKARGHRHVSHEPIEREWQWVMQGEGHAAYNAHTRASQKKCAASRKFVPYWPSSRDIAKVYKQRCVRKHTPALQLAFTANLAEQSPTEAAVANYCTSETIFLHWTEFVRTIYFLHRDHTGRAQLRFKKSWPASSQLIPNFVRHKTPFPLREMAFKRTYFKLIEVRQEPCVENGGTTHEKWHVNTCGSLSIIVIPIPPSKKKPLRLPSDTIICLPNQSRHWEGDTPSFTTLAATAGVWMAVPCRALSAAAATLSNTSNATLSLAFGTCRISALSLDVRN